jgi:hypothetical protein
MSVAVHEEEHLGNWSHTYPIGMPLPAPSRPSNHDAMFLDVDADGDTLVGRADNGKSAFDLLQQQA